MMFNFNQMNMGQDMFQQIYEICKSHSACKNCPVLEQNGLHTDNNVIICHQVIIKHTKEQTNGNG